MFKNPNTGHVFAELWFFLFWSSNSQQLCNQASINCIFPDQLFETFCDFQAIPDLHLSDDTQSFFNGVRTEKEPTNTYRIHLFGIFLIFTLLSR